MKKRLRRPHIFALVTCLSLALMHFAYIPAIGVLGRVLILFSTLAHELGHGLTAMLVGGHFDTVKIYWDASGVTHSSRPDGRIASALIAAGGLVGPSFAASFLFWSARGSDSKVKWATRILGVALIAIGFLTARSVWAIVFTIGLGALLLVSVVKLSRVKLETALVFLGVQLGLSVFTRADYLFTKTAQTGAGAMPSDVSQIAQNLFLPYWFWGGLCGLISVAVLFWGLRCYTHEND